MFRAAARGALVALLASVATLRPDGAAAQERTTVGGYGEVHYVNRTGPSTPGTVDLKRFVVYLAHTFNDQIAFRSELEVEDAKVEGAQPGGEVALEQAYLDYRLSDALTVRSGLVLPPVGIVPLSPKWASYQLDAREQAVAIYLFEEGISFRETLTVSYQGLANDSWSRSILTLERERARVIARAQSRPNP